MIILTVPGSEFEVLKTCTAFPLSSSEAGDAQGCLEIYLKVLKSEDDRVQNEESLIKHCSYLFEICGADTSNGCGAQVLVVPLTSSPISTSHWPEKEGEKVPQEPE